MKKLAIIVPYRDRENHLKQFVPHMENYLIDDLEGEAEYKIFIINQDDSKPFNRAKLLNVGFKESEEFDYFAFHDVDMLPTDSDYSYVEEPTHLATEVEQFEFKLPYDGYFGGVTIFDKANFRKINGYANEYWGWGAEDDDVLLRCAMLGVQTSRKSCRYKSLDHSRHIDGIPYQKNLNKFFDFRSNPTIETIMGDGLSTLVYEKTGEKNITPNAVYINVKI
jgi:predicted glycosyltransferase involved in capsule biosynthesis